MQKSIVAATTISTVLAFTGAATAETDEEMLRRLDAQQQQLDAQARQLEEYRAFLEQQQQQINALRASISATGASAAGAAAGAGAATGVAAGAAAGSATAAAAQTGADDQAARAEAQRRATESDRPPEVAVYADRGGVLLRRGEFVLEPAIEYQQTSSLRTSVAGFSVLPAIIIGSFDIEDVDRNSLTATLTGRAGITDRLEGELRVPFVYRNDTITDASFGSSAEGDIQTIDISDAGIGDIEAALHYQINDGEDGWPFFVGNLRYKAPTGKGPFDVDVDEDGIPTELATGTGFHGIEPSITAIYPTDPAVLFGNLGYTFNLPEDVSGIGNVDPGDVISFSAGVGFALNEELSLSLSYDHDWVLPTSFPGGDDNNVQVGRVILGGSYSINDRMSLNMDVGIGATDDASDLSVGLRLPIKFSEDDLTQ